MNERLAAREAFHAKCERMGWDTECSTCGNGLEDPDNDEFDTFCDFCYEYQIIEDDTRARHDAWIASVKVRP